MIENGDTVRHHSQRNWVGIFIGVKYKSPDHPDYDRCSILMNGCEYDVYRNELILIEKGSNMALCEGQPRQLNPTTTLFYIVKEICGCYVGGYKATLLEAKEECSELLKKHPKGKYAILVSVELHQVEEPPIKVTTYK